MSWVTSILSVVGGGWGSAVAVLALIVGALYAKHLWNKYKQGKAEKETKDKAVEDHLKVVHKNEESSSQVKKDDAANEAAINAALEGKKPEGPLPLS
jgi:H+/gluconate symporter-like permease